MNKKVIYLFMSLFLLLAGCEYELGENYIDFEEPSKDLKIDVNLGLSENEQGQFVVKDSRVIGYEINLPDFQVTKCLFRLGNKSWEGKGAYGQFSIDTNQFPNNIYELSCEVYGKMANGSIFDQVGSEISLGKKTWPLRVLVSDASDRPLSYRLKENGLVEVWWEKDEKLRASFDHYEVFVYRSKATWIYHLNNFDQCSFEDYTYNDGPVTFEVYYYPKEVTGRPFSFGKAILDVDF